MAERTIRFRIRPDGRVEETVEGAPGLLCHELTERIEARLGAVQQRSQTSEAFSGLGALQQGLAALPQTLARGPAPG